MLKWAIFSLCRRSSPSLLNYMHKWASRRKLHFTQLPAYTFALHYALLLLLSIVYLLHCTKLWFSFYVLNYASLHLFFFRITMNLFVLNYMLSSIWSKACILYCSQLHDFDYALDCFLLLRTQLCIFCVALNFALSPLWFHLVYAQLCIYSCWGARLLLRLMTYPLHYTQSHASSYGSSMYLLPRA